MHLIRHYWGMKHWDDYRFFAALRKTGTLKSAARELGTDQATVGRRVRALETRLGAKLFAKHSDGYRLTSVGERIGLAIERITADFESVERQVAGEDRRLEGVLRIAAPGALANHWLVPGLKVFTEKHPGITLEFLTGPEVVNLAKREADLALRLVRPAQRGLKVRRLGTLSLAFYGEKKLLREKGRPKSEMDLARLPFVGLFEDATSELEHRLAGPLLPHLKPVMRSRAWSSVFAAVRAGVGVGILPSFLGRIDPGLERLEALPKASTEIWVVTHPELTSNARLRALLAAIDKINL